MNDNLTFVNPEGYLPPKGYSNGALVSGPTLFVAGQVGWNAQCEFETDDLAEQFAQALDNVLAVVRAAGGGPTDLAKMTVYVTDLDAYRGSLKAIGQAWRARLGKHFPAMALLGVAGLVEKRAKVEIEAVAVLRGATDPA
ncbi:RidA family protein [Polyangium sorediatum]|uniref:RidA family protein n=1 Tax=Polyangium sorediatum TaxID=889274 RepID=A0ABT6NSI2_9BACT|nr:RidA family protein [Polyangium sorediatum]MDI1431294.1 RidA family protein [Polyangium sorediatum]